jgi:hypothetical protein
MTTTVAPMGDATPVASLPPVGAVDTGSSPAWRTRFALMVVAAVLVGFALRVAIGLTDDDARHRRDGLSALGGVAGRG